MADGRANRTGIDVETEEAFREHAEISEGVAEFEKWLGRSEGAGAEWAALLCERLLPLVKILKSHFASEECSNLYADMHIRAPGFADAVERLFDEHYDMIREIESLVRASRSIESTFDCDREELTRRARRIIFALRRHEAEENEILYQACCDDAGKDEAKR